MSFKDHFSTVSEGYALIRPTYPPNFFEALARLAPARTRAWDVGCGSGQATQHLAPLFQKIIATDASEAQIRAAPDLDNVTFAVAPAEDAALIEDHSIDLILASQSVHWFDLPQFYREVRRVARPGALVALITYLNHCIEDPAIDATFQAFARAILEAYWPPERALVESGYATIDFPFTTLAESEIVRLFDPITRDWRKADLIAYINTWSAVKEYRRKVGRDPIPMLDAALAKVWPDPETPRRVTWPVAGRIGRVSAPG